MLETLIISNSGSLGLGWDIYEEVGSTGGDNCSPDNLPWLSVDPVSGTVPASGSEEVEVLFNSTALGSGEYTGTLCIESNDAVDPVVRVPITLTVVPHEVFVPYVDS